VFLLVTERLAHFEAELAVAFAVGHRGIVTVTVPAFKMRAAR
jgi:hypothetical protein